MNSNRRSMIRRRVAVLATLLLAGAVLACGGIALALTDPGRDPFASAPATGRERPDSSVSVSGRDPFAPAETLPLDEEERLERVATGTRDPFDPELPDPIAVAPPVAPPVAGEVAVAVTVETAALCWLDLYEDGRQVLRTNVAAGSTLVLTAVNEVRFEQVGRDWAITVNVNGMDLGILEEISEGLAISPMDVVTPEGTIRITLERWHPSGVLVGLRFTVVRPGEQSEPDEDDS